MRSKSSYLKQLILALSVYLLTSPVVVAKNQDKNSATKANVIECKQEVGDYNSGKVNQACVGDINNINDVYINFSKNSEYQALEEAVLKAQDRYDKLLNIIYKSPKESKLHDELKEISQQLKERQKDLKNFKKDVIELAEYFNKIPINTERLRKAKSLFNAGKYGEARRFLEKENPNIRKEQEALLKQKENNKALPY
ncbi:MAG TPA: hypothetical protein EYH35_02570 [Thiotrichaceae bacterium]|nr:hypothetical protein [Thiotrichaceae bacterium]